VTHGIRAHLAGEVDLNGRVDGDHPAILGDDEGVIDVLGGVELHQRVVVGIVVELVAPHQKAADQLPRVERLALVGDDPCVHQVDDAVGEHLCVYAEMAAVSQLGQHRVGDGTDPHLERGFVLDDPRHVLADAAVLIGEFGPGQGGQGITVLHRRVKLAHVDERVAEGPRHPVVHLGNHAARRLGGRLHDVHGDAERAETVLIRRRHLDQSDVDGELIPKQGRDGAEKHGYVVRLPRIDRLAHVGAHEERVVAERPLVLRLGVR